MVEVAEVACVLRTRPHNESRRLGGTYGPEHVRALARGLAEHLPGARLTALTDVETKALPPDVRHVPLEHDLPGWWSKMELLRPGIFGGPVLYMDLDTLITGSLAEIAAHRCSFAMLADFNNPLRLTQSGVLLFTPGRVTQDLWAAWIRDPAGHMARNRGDGEWLHSMGAATDRIQDLYPGQVVSFKRHGRERCPEGARLVCLHGRPRPHDTAAGWAHELWRKRAA